MTGYTYVEPHEDGQFLRHADVARAEHLRESMADESKSEYILSRSLKSASSGRPGLLGYSEYTGTTCDVVLELYEASSRLGCSGSEHPTPNTTKQRIGD